MGEGIADCLHPLGEVGVLEHEAVELVWVGIGRVFGSASNPRNVYFGGTNALPWVSLRLFCAAAALKLCMQ